jgi:hypothetical protein
MSLRDMLNAEGADARRAADAAKTGASLSGLSGRHSNVDDEPIFGARIDPAVTRGADDNPNAGPALTEARSRVAAATRVRIPFGGAELRLAYATRDGYRRYWFNDVPGRLFRAKQAGYEHVIDPATGDNVQLVTGRQQGGQELRTYLLEIPEEWYWQDMEVQQNDLERRLSDIRTGRAGPGVEDNRYVPSKGIYFGKQRTA